MKSDQRLFYTVGEVAAMLGLSRTYVYAKFDPEKGIMGQFSRQKFKIFIMN